MRSPDNSRHVEVKDGDQTVAAAEVTTVRHAGGPSGHRCCHHPGPRRQAAGPAWSMPLRERAEDTVTRPAGSTALVDADMPPGGPASAS